MSTAINSEQKVLNKSKSLIEIIRRAKVDTTYCYNSQKLMDDKIGHMARNCGSVLDFGRSSRAHFGLFKPGQAQTADINQYDGYPDIICDICDASTLPARKYDGIVCNAVIEHVYDPFAAVRNMYDLLNDGGICMCYAPFVFSYHAPADLMFQDYFRFSRDGLALLFKDYKDVTLYSIRGRSSSALNYGVPGWKKIERRAGFINRMVDSLFGGKEDPLQVTGYVVWAER